MTLHAVVYYEVRCNELGCKERPNDEYAAWSEPDVAEEDAEHAGWSKDNEGHHWCPDHTPACPPGQHVREYEDDLCQRCQKWPEDDEEEDTDV
jgi:hypothetical protein